MKLRLNKKVLLLAMTSTLGLCGCGIESEVEEVNSVNFEYLTDSPENYYENDLISYEEVLDKTLPVNEETVDNGYIISDGDFVKATDTVNIRKYANTESEKIDLLGIGTSAKYLGEENGFYKIEYLDKVGYVSKDYSYVYNREHINGEVVKNVCFTKDTTLYNDYMESKAVIPKNEMGHVYEDLVDSYLVEADGVVGYVDKVNTVDLTDTYAVVDISEQELNIYNGTEVLLTSPCVTGAPSSPTKEGCFEIYNITHNRRLYSSPSCKPFVNIMMKFDHNRGLHDAEHYNDPKFGFHGWRDTEEFGGNTYLTNGSHGCCNLPHDAAITAGELLTYGSKVLVKK